MDMTSNKIKIRELSGDEALKLLRGTGKPLCFVDIAILIASSAQDVAELLRLANDIWGIESVDDEHRAAKAASRPFDESAIRRWATDRISGLAEAIDGRRKTSMSAVS